MTAKQRDIGQEVLAGLQEIEAWQRGEKKLKTTKIVLPTAIDVARKCRDALRASHKS